MSYMHTIVGPPLGEFGDFGLPGVCQFRFLAEADPVTGPCSQWFGKSRMRQGIDSGRCLAMTQATSGRALSAAHASWGGYS